MAEYIFHFILVSILIIGLTAILGVMTGGIGLHVFGRKHRSEFVIQSEKTAKGFTMVGGKNS